MTINYAIYCLIIAYKFDNVRLKIVYYQKELLGGIYREEMFRTNSHFSYVATSNSYS